MHRQKGTPNTPQVIIDEIIEKHREGKTLRELAVEYEKPYKTIKSMIWRENNKKRKQAVGVFPNKQRGRKPAKTLQEYKYENKRLKMENELLRDFLYLAGRM
jgi:hypothetical protein